MTEAAKCIDTPQVDSCPLCDLPGKPKSEFDVSTPIDEEGDVVLKPDLGMLMAGHLLAVTKEHLTSFAQLDPERLGVIDRCLGSYEDRLAHQFGRYFRVEHGSDNITTHGSGGCVEHAHIHLIPADEDAGSHIQEQLSWQKLDNYEDLSNFRGVPYIYLGRTAMHYVIPNPRLSGQWIRRQVAAIRGMEQWDWALFDSREELNATFKGIRALSLPIFQSETGDNR